MKDLIKVEQLISDQESKFDELNEENGANVNFKKESVYAMQVLKEKKYTLETAQKNPESLKNAIANIAAVGLSLNPVHGYAYLVPRGGAVCLDFGYKGLVKLATDLGSILHAQAHLVHKNDVYEFILGEKPIFKKKPFSKDRGEIVGVFCLAKLYDGSWMAEEMGIEEIISIRDRYSTGYQAFKNKKAKSSSWETDLGEMIKKTVIRRASKSWPKTNKMIRLDNAIGIINENDGINFAKEQAPILATENQLEEIKKILKAMNKDEASLLGYASRVNKRTISSLPELSKEEAKKLIVVFNDIINKHNKELSNG